MPRLTRVKCVGRLLSRWGLMLCFDFGSVRACTRSKTRREGGQLTRALARAKKGAPAIYAPPGTPSSRINFSPILPEIDLTPDETRSGGGGRGEEEERKMAVPRKRVLSLLLQANIVNARGISSEERATSSTLLRHVACNGTSRYCVLDVFGDRTYVTVRARELVFAEAISKLLTRGDMSSSGRRNCGKE